jgi:hypothetical protein
MQEIVHAETKAALKEITTTYGVTGFAAYDQLLLHYELRQLRIELTDFYKIDLMHILLNVHKAFFDLLKGSSRNCRVNGKFLHLFSPSCPMSFMFRYLLQRKIRGLG